MGFFYCVHSFKNSLLDLKKKNSFQNSDLKETKAPPGVVCVSLHLSLKCNISSVKQIASPGWMHETSAQGWCTGKTQRDGMGREGSGWGTHVNPQLIHVNVRQKPLQYCKVISPQLIKINEEKKKKEYP